MKLLNKVLEHTENILISTSILFSAVLLFVNVVLRYVFHTGIIWAEELTMYLIVWITFVGGSVCVRHGAHLCVSVLLEFIDGMLKKIVVTVAHLITMSFTLFLTYYGWQLVAHSYKIGQVSPALRAPVYIIYLAIPIGGALMTLRLVQQLVGEWSAQKSGAESTLPPVREVG